MLIYHGVYSYCDSEGFWSVRLGWLLETRKLRQSPHTKLKEASTVDAKGSDERGKRLRTPGSRCYMAAIQRKIAGCPKPEEASSHLKINTDEQRSQGTAGRMRERTSRPWWLHQCYAGCMLGLALLASPASRTLWGMVDMSVIDPKDFNHPWLSGTFPEQLPWPWLESSFQ